MKLMLTVVLLIQIMADNYVYGDVYDSEANACRGANATLSYGKPPELENFDYIYLFFTPIPTAEIPNPQEQEVMSKFRTDNWIMNENFRGFHGRIFNTSLTSFVIDSSLTRDRGLYTIEILSQSGTYKNTTDLMIYAEDNLYPSSTSDNGTDVAGEDESGNTQYTYTFEQPENSPCTGVRMYATSDGRTSRPQECSFGDSDWCEVVFTTEALDGFSGTVVMSVEPLFANGDPNCTKVNQPFYSLMITILPSRGPSKGAIGGMVVAAVAIVVIACVIPVAVTSYRKKQYKHIPLSKGLAFVEYCTGKIETYDNWRDLKGIYREGKPKSMTKSFIEFYRKKNGDLGDEFDDERKQLAAAIKMFMAEEKSPWLPLEMQRRITRQEKNYMLGGDLDVNAVKSLVANPSDRKERQRTDILRHLLLHFKWLTDLQKNLEPHSNVVDLQGLATCVGPNFFKEATEEYMVSIASLSAVEKQQKGMAIAKPQNDFCAQLIDHAHDIFPADSETINMADLSKRQLLDDKENNQDDERKII